MGPKCGVQIIEAHSVRHKVWGAKCGGAKCGMQGFGRKVWAQSMEQRILIQQDYCIFDRFSSLF